MGLRIDALVQWGLGEVIGRQQMLKKKSMGSKHRGG